jgi:hypothetical protein
MSITHCLLVPPDGHPPRPLVHGEPGGLPRRPSAPPLHRTSARAARAGERFRTGLSANMDAHPMDRAGGHAPLMSAGHAFAGRGGR